jgi:hypothetical protein
MKVSSVGWSKHRRHRAYESLAAWPSCLLAWGMLETTKQTNQTCSWPPHSATRRIIIVIMPPDLHDIAQQLTFNCVDAPDSHGTDTVLPLASFTLVVAGSQFR